MTVVVAAPPPRGPDDGGAAGALVAYAYDLMDKGTELERPDLVAMICDHVRALATAHSVVVWLLDEHGIPNAEGVAGGRPTAAGLAVERAFVELIAGERPPLLTSTEPPLRPGLPELCARLARERSSAVSVAIERRDELLGVLCLHRIGGRPFDGREAADAERYGGFAGLALHRMAERERAERDEVTGMLGRAALLRELEERLATGRTFALACVDFDGLKGVNETRGYEAGNDLIRAVAAAVISLMRPGELAGRLHGRGGDEFMCVLDEPDQASLERRCQAIEAALDRAAMPSGLARSYLGVSVGGALASGSTVASLLTSAETAMRERKRERRRSQGRSDPTA